MDPVSTTPSIMKFGNDVVVPEPSTTNTKNYTVLDSDAAKQDYQTKNSWLNTEQNNIINQSLLNQQNTATTKSTSDANGATKSVADSINGATSALTGGSGTGTKTATTANGNTYNVTGDAYSDTLAGQNADNAAMYKQTQAKLATASTMAGLSTDQQTQITNLASQYDDLIGKQTAANNEYQGGVTMSTVRSGADRYAQTLAESTVTQAVNEGIAKITKIQNDKSSALQKMQSGFISDNVKAVNDAYKAYSDFTKEQNDNIKEMQTHLNDLQTQQLNQQKEALDEQKTQAAFNKDNNVVSPFYQLAGSSVVYDSKTGQPISSDQYKQMGGAGGDYKDIQQISPTDNTKHSASYTEWQDYQKTGGKLSFNDYMNMDANRKATRVTNNTVTYNQAKDQAQTQAAGMVGSGLAKKVGSDGYVSPSDFKSALAAWTSDGYAAKDFYDQFKNYINPADTNILTGVSDYGAYK